MGSFTAGTGSYGIDNTYFSATHGMLEDQDR